MWLVDTNVWSTHLRQGEPRLIDLLLNNEVLMHEHVFLELTLGCQTPRQRRWLPELRRLKYVPSLSNEEIGPFIDRHKLYGCGMGLVDVHILAAVKVASEETGLWTRDRAMIRMASRLGIKTF